MSQIHITRAVHKETKQTIFVENVQSGLQENIVCACCGGKLVANKGKKKAWYFSHHFDEVCAFAYETQLHLTAKEFFAKNGQIPVPLDAGWITPEGCAYLNISNVNVEVYMDGRRPDLIVEIGSELYWIEIANKHKCEADKIWECRANSRNIIEIDVSNSGHLDKFDSLEHCLVRIQSINPCNDYLDEITQSTAHKHEKVRKQFEAMIRSQKNLEVEKDKQERTEKTLEQRIEAQQKKYDEKLTSMRIRESAQDEMLVELDKAIEAQQLKLNEINNRKENLESEISSQVAVRINELNIHNTATLDRLKDQLSNEWKQEVMQKREHLKQELLKEREPLVQELEHQFQLKINLMKKLRHEYSQNQSDLKSIRYEKDALINEVKELSINKKSLVDGQAKLFQEKVGTLIQKRRDIEQEIYHLEQAKIEKFNEIGLTDTYANNMEEVRDFCLARSDYRVTTNQRMQKLQSLTKKSLLLSQEYDEKYQQLDIIIKLTNDFDDAIRESFEGLELENLLSKLHEGLVSRIKTHKIVRSRNAKEELEDHDMRISIK